MYIPEYDYPIARLVYGSPEDSSEPQHRSDDSSEFPDDNGATLLRKYREKIEKERIEQLGCRRRLW